MTQIVNCLCMLLTLPPVGLCDHATLRFDIGKKTHRQTRYMHTGRCKQKSQQRASPERGYYGIRAPLLMKCVSIETLSRCLVAGCLHVEVNSHSFGGLVLCTDCLTIFCGQASSCLLVYLTVVVLTRSFVFMFTHVQHHVQVACAIP